MLSNTLTLAGRCRSWKGEAVIPKSSHSRIKLILRYSTGLCRLDCLCGVLDLLLCIRSSDSLPDVLLHASTGPSNSQLMRNGKEGERVKGEEGERLGGAAVEWSGVQNRRQGSSSGERELILTKTNKKMAGKACLQEGTKRQTLSSRLAGNQVFPPNNNCKCACVRASLYSS